LQISNFRHIGAAALLCRLDRMGLQTVLPDAFGIGVVGLHRHDPCGSHLGGFFDDKIGARLFDRRKEQPQVRRHLQWACQRLCHQNTVAFSRFDDACGKLSIPSVEQRQRVADSKPHHAKEVMRLIARQDDRLPCGQRMIYIESDGTGCHNADDRRQMTDIPETTGQVADAVRGNWVDRIAPEPTRPYLRLSRADRPIGTWLLLLPCWWGLLLASAANGVFGWREAWIFVGCAIGAWLMRGAGCTWNDITDRHIDGSVERTASRPIPSGQVSVKGAVLWMCAQALIAFCILLTFNIAAIALGIGSLVLVCIYPFAKRFTWWPQVFLGLAFNWGALLAWTAQDGALGWPAVLLYLAGISWTLFYDTIYAHQDKEDDALIGVKSTARLFAENTPKYLFGFMVITVALMTMAIIFALAPGKNPLTLVIALAGPWAFGWNLTWQMRQLNINDTENCLRLFRANRNGGLIPVLFLAGALFV